METPTITINMDTPCTECGKGGATPSGLCLGCIGKQILNLDPKRDFKKIKVDSIDPQPIGEKRIIVADRGWVFAGDCEDMPDGTVTIRNAQCIRIWGTTKGLGELRDGPLASTKLDPYGTVRTKAIVTINITSGW